MENEIIFRILLLVLFVSFVAHRGYYHRKLNQSDSKTVKQPKREVAPALAGLFSLVGLIAVAIYIVYPAWMSWASLPFSNGLRWVGVGLAVLGFVVLQWAQLTLDKNWSSAPRLMAEQTLTTGGPYRWIRHPIYTAFYLILGATLFISANWFIGLAWIGMTTLEVLSRINVEEAMLMEQFGDQYRTYMTKTGRLLPRIIR